MDLIRLDNVALSTETSAHNQYPVDVIAIHGLNGHYERTWTENGTLWLRDLLPEDLPGARVYSFGYDSRIFTDTVMTIGDYALELLNAISRERASDEVMLLNFNEECIFTAYINKSVRHVADLLSSFATALADWSPRR